MREPLFSIYAAFVLTFIAVGGAARAEGDPSLPRRDAVADEIRREAIRPNHDPAGRPLPLAALWNAGATADGYTPVVQLQLIHEGHHLMPTLYLPTPVGRRSDPSYYERAIREVQLLKLPLTLVSTQWESLLLEPALADTVAKAGFVVGSRESRLLSPFRCLPAWDRVGAKWGGTRMLKQIEAWYPDPPLIVFLSNNEAPKLSWTDADSDPRYVSRYAAWQGDEFKKKIVAHAWTGCYRALERGFRAALVAPAWAERSLFVGYNAFGPSFLGRLPRWRRHSLVTADRLTAEADGWDGASVAFYVNSWDASTDFTVFSPQIAAMNWIPMLAEIDPSRNFWLEVSTWDGAEPDGVRDKRATYRRLGQAFSPERYAGMVQFGMWLLRPRVIREYRGYREARRDTAAYFDAVLNAVDRIYTNAVLEEFWRHGQLVPNSAHEHPYSFALGSHAGLERWFLLDTDLDPPRPWSLETELKVLALALVVGDAGSRRWLVYAHSPLRTRPRVRISIPDFSSFTVPVKVRGSFFVVDEATANIQEVAP